MFCDKIVKLSVNLNKSNLLNSYLKFTDLTHFCIFCNHFYYGEKYDIWFYVKGKQTFVNLVLLYKAPGKKRLSERCSKERRYPDDLLNIDNICFELMIDQIYPTEHQLNKDSASNLSSIITRNI